MTRYEYKVLGRIKEVELNELGAEGWRVVHTMLTDVSTSTPYSYGGNYKIVVIMERAIAD